MPHPRAGLWTWVAANGRGDFCSSGQPVHIPDSTVACPTVTYAKTDKGVEIDGVCGEGEVVSKIQMVFSGDFHSAYTVDTHTDLAITGKTPIVSDMHARFSFAGPCPQGRAADDLK